MGSPKSLPVRCSPGCQAEVPPQVPVRRVLPARVDVCSHSFSHPLKPVPAAMLGFLQATNVPPDRSQEVVTENLFHGSYIPGDACKQLRIRIQVPEVVGRHFVVAVVVARLSVRAFTAQPRSLVCTECSALRVGGPGNLCILCSPLASGAAFPGVYSPSRVLGDKGHPDPGYHPESTPLRSSKVSPSSPCSLSSHPPSLRLSHRLPRQP